jgi:hypothetical protein
MDYTKKIELFMPELLIESNHWIALCVRIRGFVVDDCEECYSLVLTLCSLVEVLLTLIICIRMVTASNLRSKTEYSDIGTRDLPQFMNSKTCLKRNLEGPEHFSAEARFPFNQGIA